MAPQLTTRSIELKRVVITGMGTVSPLGNDVATSWSAALNPSLSISINMATGFMKQAYTVISVSII